MKKTSKRAAGGRGMTPERIKREAAIIADIKAGELSYRQIASKHEVSLPTVNNKARKAGISRGRREGAKIVLPAPRRNAPHDPDPQPPEHCGRRREARRTVVVAGHDDDLQPWRARRQICEEAVEELLRRSRRNAAVEDVAGHDEHVDRRLDELIDEPAQVAPLRGLERDAVERPAQVPVRGMTESEAHLARTFSPALD